MENTRHLSMAVDFGEGRHADLEFGEPDQAWIAIGRSVAVTDVWLKGGHEMIDLRVRLRRTVGGVEISVDRGDGNEPWWPARAEPRLAIAASPAAGTATAVASAGTDQDFQQVLLGRARI